MIFLGTGAAECFPNPFCQCAACRQALEGHDKKLKRRRSALLLDPHTLVDFGPDVMFACAEYGLSLSALRNIFVTHSHEDHFCLWNLNFLQMSITPVQPVKIFLSESAHEGILKSLMAIRQINAPQMQAELEQMQTLYEWIPLQEYKRIAVDDFFVTPMRAHHKGFFYDEWGLNFLFEKNGKKLYYASDTGLFEEETYQALLGHRLDTLVIEGTFGKQNLEEDAGHLSHAHLCRVLNRLSEQGTLNTKTKVYVTHIAHHAQYSHYEYEELLQTQYGQRIWIAYDGMKASYCEQEQALNK